MNRPPLRILLLACLAISGLLVAACGDSEGDDAAIAAIAETVGATSQIESGRLTASFGLEPEGLLALGGAITARAAGPFAAPAAGELPRSKLSLSGSLGGQDLRATATTTGERAFLRLDGKDYEVDGDTVGALTEALGGESGGGFASLGLDPSAWITDAETQDDVTVGGIDTTHVSGEIDAAALLADVARLLDGAGFGGLLTDKLREQIADGVKSSKVDVYSGVDDQMLRRLELAVEFEFEQGQSPITGLEGGTIDLRLRVDDVNDTEVEAQAPDDPRPLSKLEGGLGSLLQGLGPAPPAGGSGDPGDGGKAFLDCVDKAQGDPDEVAKCATELEP